MVVVMLIAATFVSAMARPQAAHRTKAAVLGSIVASSLPTSSAKPSTKQMATTTFLLAFNRTCAASEPVVSGKRVTLSFANAANGITSLDEVVTTLQTSVKGLTDVLCVETPTKKTSSASTLTVTFVMVQPPDSCSLAGNGTAKHTLTLFFKPKIKDRPTEKASSPAKLLDSNATRPKNKWALDVIVLDAGHGGKDAGAVGVTGVKEKDVVLGIVKKLGGLIKKNMVGTKVVFTRSDDTFVELDRRGQIANEAGGKLFVSVHCNSTPKKPAPARGFEVYILRPGKTEEAVQVAEFENSVVRFESDTKRYKKLTDEQFIIINMAQNSFVKFSDKFASLLVREVGKTTTLPMRGVSQAGFYVLVGASMPNVLIETAFVSNKNDEKYLKSERGQQQLAQGMFNAIKAYRDFYERQLQREGEEKR
jgi:N-acetylmuramoyl-L-alanine amidase